MTTGLWSGGPQPQTVNPPNKLRSRSHSKSPVVADTRARFAVGVAVPLALAAVPGTSSVTGAFSACT
jgi:hypothetical protein